MLNDKGFASDFINYSLYIVNCKLVKVVCIENYGVYGKKILSCKLNKIADFIIRIVKICYKNI